MGILPLEFLAGTSAQTLHLIGDELFDLTGDADGVKTGQMLDLIVHRSDGTTTTVPLLARIDSAIEETYFRHGGILPYVLRERLARQA
ncbi:aconitate hydratase Acn [Mycobacteroides abscessus subsp. abscessus]|nr:aconitate hydratase Acn [Mycobacteroides abscessus subsp. abscessus]